jgi:hypothetical protein
MENIEHNTDYEPDACDTELDKLDKMDKNLEKQLLADKKERKKEYYVKGADLVAEIRKYQISKKEDADAKRNSI